MITSTETINSWMLWTTGTEASVGSDNSPGIPGSLYRNHNINRSELTVTQTKNVLKVLMFFLRGFISKIFTFRT